MNKVKFSQSKWPRYSHRQNFSSLQIGDEIVTNFSRHDPGPAKVHTIVGITPAGGIIVNVTSQRQFGVGLDDQYIVEA